MFQYIIRKKVIFVTVSPFRNIKSMIFTHKKGEKNNFLQTSVIYKPSLASRNAKTDDEVARLQYTSAARRFSRWSHSGVRRCDADHNNRITVIANLSFHSACTCFIRVTRAKTRDLFLLNRERLHSFASEWGELASDINKVINEAGLAYKAH